MKRYCIFALLIVTLFCSCTYAEDLFVRDTGVLYSVKSLVNIYDKDRFNEWGLPELVMNSVEHDDKSIEFNLLEITMLEANDVEYYIHCYIFNKNKFDSRHKYFSMEEKNGILKALYKIRDFIENHEQYDVKLYYAVDNDMVLIGERDFDPCLKICIFDEYINIYDIKEVDIIISFFENTETMINANKDL